MHKSLVLSQAGIYRLQQLATVVRQKTGVRHKLSDPKDFINLLRFSCTSPDSNIYDSYNYFTNELDEDQRLSLQDRGLLMPAIIFSQASFSQISNAGNLRPVAR
jgi:hypothetical protein